MLIIFTVKDQKITHDLEGSLVSDSCGIVQGAFKFDSSWDDFTKVIVFSNSKCKKPIPVEYKGKAVDIPLDALKPGKLYVSVVGFGDGNQKKTTRKWDIMQAITVQQCGDMGDCDLLRSMVTVPDSKVATDEEVEDMFDDVFEEPEVPGTVGDEMVTTDEEFQEMFDEVFNAKGPAEDTP